MRLDRKIKNRTIYSLFTVSRCIVFFFSTQPNRVFKIDDFEYTTCLVGWYVFFVQCFGWHNIQFAIVVIWTNDKIIISYRNYDTKQITIACSEFKTVPLNTIVYKKKKKIRTLLPYTFRIKTCRRRIYYTKQEMFDRVPVWTAVCSRQEIVAVWNFFSTKTCLLLYTRYWI